MRGDGLCPGEHLDVLPPGDLVDEVPGHALLEAVSAAEHGHAPRMGREREGRLPGRVAGPDDVDVEAVRARGVAARGTVEDALAREAVGALDREPPPRDAAGEDDRPGPQHVPSVQVDVPRRPLDPRDRPRHEDLGPEPLGLRESLLRELIAGHARREAEVVLDPRRRARLPPGRLPLDCDDVEALGSPVDGGRETRRAGSRR